MEFNIRFATASDICQLIELLYQLGYLDSEGGLEQKISNVLKYDEQRLLVCEDERWVQGFAAMQLVRDIGVIHNTAIITYLVVRDNCRSKGIDALLESACCSLARELRCGRIELHCGVHRTKAHVFYEELGYSESPNFFTKRLDVKSDNRY